LIDLFIYLFVCLFVYYPPYVSTEGYIGCCFFLSPVTDISATVAPIGVILHDGTYRSRTESLPLWDGASREILNCKIFGLSFGQVTADISKAVSCSVTCRRELSKNVSYGYGAVAPPPGVHPRMLTHLFIYLFITKLCT